MEGRAPGYGLLPRLVLVLAAVGCIMLAASVPGIADWRDDLKAAAIKYADDKKSELVKDQAKAAIFALYSRLYKSGASRGLSRKLAEVAISAPDLNKLAEETAEAYGSGDPDKIREASGQVAVKFGEHLSKLASTPELRGQLGAIIGSADKVKEVSDMLGNVAAGTSESRRAAAEYIGQVLINATPGAAIVGFYQGAQGAMSYANNQYVDAKIEDLYKTYRGGDAHSRELLVDQLRAGTGGYHYVIENRRKELEQEKLAAIADASAAASARVKELLTKTTDDEIIGNIIASFNSRIEMERKDAAAAAEREKARKEAESILSELDWAAKGRNGNDWYEKAPVNLEKFAAVVRDQLKADGLLDPQNPLHVQLMSKTASIALIYGKNSKEYAKALAELDKARNDAIAANKGAPCTEGSPAQALASRLWQKGRKLVAGAKISAALAVMKQSLEFCPDEERAAQLAELSKAAKPTAQGFDGSYAGTMRIQAKPSSGTADGSLVLTVKGGRLSGSFSWRQAGVSATVVSSRTIEAAISGQVSEDGRITATLTGKSNAEVKPGTAHAGILMTALLTFSFQGRFTGSMADNGASGSVAAQKAAFAKDKPPEMMTGTWTVSRR